MQRSTTPKQAWQDPALFERAGAKRISWMDDAAKRALDIGVSLVFIVLLAPFVLILAVWIKRDSPGPVFYRGPRLGKGGQVFRIIKFRTMYERPESYAGPRVTAGGDERVTKVGRWLRDSKLNELPQFWNVLTGDMSLVGPRPEDPQLGQAWPADVSEEVLSIRPGITSPASVMFHKEESLLNPSKLLDSYLGAILPSKLRLEQLYVRHRSILLDLDVLFWTLLVLLPKIGAAAPPEEHLFLGPFSRLMRRYVNWFAIDMIVTFVAIGITGVFWRSLGPLDVGYTKAIGIAVGFALLYSMVGALMGVNRIVWSKAGLTDAVDLIPAVVLSTAIALLFNLFWNAQPILPPGMILMTAVVAFTGFVLVRYRSRLVSALASRWLKLRGGVFEAQERVLIIGGGESGQFLAWWLHSGNAGGLFRVAGFIDDDLYKQNTRIHGVDVLGRREDIPELVAKFDVGLILFAIHNIPIEERRRLLTICSSTPARVMMIPDVLGSLRDLVKGNGAKPGASPAGAVAEISHTGGLIPSTQVADWLEELGEMTKAEDLDGVRAKIRVLKSQIGSTEPD